MRAAGTAQAGSHVRSASERLVHSKERASTSDRHEIPPCDSKASAYNEFRRFFTPYRRKISFSQRTGADLPALHDRKNSVSTGRRLEGAHFFHGKTR
jgi:hypothetical protein